jgi:CheY-like chemotaxis protein
MFSIFKKRSHKLKPAKTKFMLADDDADDAHLFCEALSKVAPASQCLTVENGRRLFEVLPDINPGPDVIFIDINMPVMNGWETLKKLKIDPNYREIPAIIYSTSSARQDVSKAYSLGATFFMTKPEDFRELCKILEIVATNSLESLANLLRGFSSIKLN